MQSHEPVSKDTLVFLEGANVLCFVFYFEFFLKSFASIVNWFCKYIKFYEELKINNCKFFKGVLESLFIKKGHKTTVSKGPQQKGS